MIAGRAAGQTNETMPFSGLKSVCVPRGTPMFFLFAEDNPDQIELFKAACQRAGLLQDSFFIAGDGLQAISYLERAASQRGAFARPSAIITDLNMPRLDGWRLLSWVKGNSHFRDLPVFIITGGLTPETREFAQSLGVNGIVEKPGSLDALSELITSLCKNASAENANPPPLRLVED
jgi:CheY-like chemotaxis protein